MDRATLIEHQQRQARADAKLALHASRMKKAGVSAPQKAEDVQLMNELRLNKATVDFNRALFDFGAGFDPGADATKV